MKLFPEKLRAVKAKVPPPAALESISVDEDFVNDLIRSGKAVELKPGQKLPQDAEYEVVIVNGQKRLIHHRVS